MRLNPFSALWDFSLSFHHSQWSVCHAELTDKTCNGPLGGTLCTAQHFIDKYQEKKLWLHILSRFVKYNLFSIIIRKISLDKDCKAYWVKIKLISSTKISINNAWHTHKIRSNKFTYGLIMID